MAEHTMATATELAKSDQQIAADLAKRGEALYQARWRETLEAAHHGDYIAIEPDSGVYFLGKTLGEAINVARAAIPGCLTYVRRIGYRGVFGIGCCPFDRDHRG